MKRFLLWFILVFGTTHMDRACAQADTVTIMEGSAVNTAPVRSGHALDSIVPSSYFYGSASASYTTSDNWSGRDLRNLSFVGGLLYKHSIVRGDRAHAHQVQADLGFLKFTDSTWVKNVDRLQVGLLWNATSRNIDRSWSIMLNTQFLPNTVWEPTLEGDRTQERKIGGFMNPFSLDAGYGAVWSFWERSSINFAFATVHLAAAPKETTPEALAGTELVESGSAYYFLRYGFSIAATIDRELGKRVQWINTTRFFGNGLDRDHVNLDVVNMVVVKVWKHLQLRFDTRLAYDPLLNYRMQFRQEALIGFFYEARK